MQEDSLIDTRTYIHEKPTVYYSVQWCIQGKPEQEGGREIGIFLSRHLKFRKIPWLLVLHMFVQFTVKHCKALMFALSTN